MKWIILTLFLLNFALGGYQYWDMSQPETSVVVRSAAQMNNLAIDQSTLEQLARFERRSSAGSAVEPLQCIRISGILAEGEAIILQSRLRALEVESELSERNEVIRTDYWVVVGPFETGEQSRARLAELKANNVESFLISEGRLAGGISLGLFSSNENARSLAAGLAERDINARVEQVDRNRRTWVLTIAAESARLISNEGLESTVSEIEGASFQRFRC